MQRFAIVFTMLLIAVLSAAADHWPSWRGADMNGHCKEKNLPTQWSADGTNVKWKVPLPGPGMSTPIVWGERVFITQSLDLAGHQRAVICFDRKDGKELWRGVTDYADNESTYAGERHFCSASPTTDGERVVASFGSVGLVCYDFAGKLLWRRDLGKCEQIWGNAASPTIHENLVIHNFGPGERTFLIAVDKRTGKDVWKVDIPDGRYGTSNVDWTGSWSTPVIARGKSGDELIITWPGAVVAYEPKTGKERWRCGGLGKLVYTSPLITPDIIVAMSGFGGPYLAMKRENANAPAARGDVTETHRLWREERAQQRVGSGVVVGDHVYILNDPGTMQCLELKTGKTLYNERIGTGSWGSMVYADGKLFVINRQGETFILAAKPDAPEVLQRNALNEKCQSSPAFSNGELFIRTYQHLWCIGEKK